MAIPILKQQPAFHKTKLSKLMNLWDGRRPDHLTSGTIFMAFIWGNLKLDAITCSGSIVEQNPAHLLRGGPNFDPVKYVKEVSHVEHMHANLILIHPCFSSKLVITWLNLFQNLILIRFQTVRKLNFDPVWTNEGGSKLSFRTNWVTWSLISKKNLDGSKLSRNAYATSDFCVNNFWVK